MLNSGCNPYMSGKATQLSSHIPWGKCVLPFLVLLKGEGRLGKNKTSIPPDKTAYGFTHMKLFLAPEALLLLCFITRAGILLRESFRKLLLDEPNFCWILNFWKLVLPLLFLLQSQGALQTKRLWCAFDGLPPPFRRLGKQKGKEPSLKGWLKCGELSTRSSNGKGGTTRRCHIHVDWEQNISHEGWD